LLYSPYDLRHGAASLLIAQGADLMDIKTQLGHSQIALTANTYGHLFMERKRQLTEGWASCSAAVKQKRNPARHNWQPVSSTSSSRSTRLLKWPDAALPMSKYEPLRCRLSNGLTYGQAAWCCNRVSAAFAKRWSIPSACGD
jgi:hypothetical protein